MTAIRPERLGTDMIGPEKPGPGPETFPPNRKAPHKLSEVDEAAASAFEGEIREFVRRDVVRRPRSGAEPVSDPVSENLNVLIRRVCSGSMEEIDRVILELQSVRVMLRHEGERLSREIAGYASLSHASMTAMKVIADSLTQWKSGPEMPSQRSAN